jgi:hypothetical protein
MFDGPMGDAILTKTRQLVFHDDSQTDFFFRIEGSRLEGKEGERAEDNQVVRRMS